MMSTQIQNNNRPRNNRRPNHMPNRTAFSSANSHRRETPENETPPSPNCKGIYEDPRTAMMMCTVLGAHSTVKTRNGNKYKGHTTAFSDKGDIAMVGAKLEVEDSAVEQYIPGIVIPKDNFVVCMTHGVDVKGLSIGSSDFTDAGIASRVNGSSQSGMKELQPWQDEDADTLTSMALDDDHTGGWEPKDMFQENKDKFNIKSSYKDDLRGYTTDLPDPTSEGYEERRRFAELKAEEIERSEVYRSRIAKENEDGDEEAKYSSVHRTEKESAINKGPDGHTGPPVKSTYTCPQLRGQDVDHSMMRNGAQSRQTGRPAPRQNSPNFPHQQLHNPRQHHMNNHFNQGPPMHNRNPRQIPSQSPNHGPPGPHSHHPHSIPQTQPPAPPLSQAPLQQPHHQQPPPRPHHPQQPPSQSSKPNILPHPNVPSLNQHPQHMTASKIAHSQPPMPESVHTSQQQPPVNRMPHAPPQHMNGGKNGQHVPDVNASHKHVDRYGGAPPNQAATPPIPSSPKVSESVTNSSAVDHKPVTVVNTQIATSPPTVQGADKRNGRGQESVSDENRNKVKDKKDNKVQQLMDFKHNFKLDDSAKAQESSSESIEESSKSTTASSGIGSTETTFASSSSVPSTPSESLSTASNKSAEKTSESDSSKSEVTKSTLNPLAAEFKPKVQPTPVEAQPSPPPLRLSPQVIPPAYAAGPVTWVPAGAIPPYQARAKSVLPVGRDITAQVTGQPLLAHHGPPAYILQQGQPYQVYSRVPNSFAASQAGQQAALDQSSPQPPQVFVPTAMPAHLPHHPQPAHGQPMPNPSNGQQPQPAHMPNPAPSPVQQQQQQHQQQPQTHGGQPMPHPMSQGPPQSVTPQPAHYPHVSLQPGIQAMPRTSSGQHVAAGPGVHPSVSINYPLQQYSSYPNASSSQNTFAPAPQPQMSQSSSHHTPGHQPQYVVMPQPQGHTSMQPIPGQPIFQQQNILHAPPQMPPTVHGHNPNQGNFIPSGVQGLPAGMPQALMSMQSLPQSYQHQQ